MGRFLGNGYDVRASVGHVRDLLRSRLSVDVENDFEPTYRVPNEKRDVVKGLKSAAAQAEEVYLATDPDREGEAIAWHLVEAAEIPREKTRRVVFHEITQGAIQEAFATAATSTWIWWTRSRLAASSTGWWAIRSARCCGAGAAAGCRRAGCSRWRCG